MPSWGSLPRGARAGPCLPGRGTVAVVPCTSPTKLGSIVKVDDPPPPPAPTQTPRGARVPGRQRLVWKTSHFPFLPSAPQQGGVLGILASGERGPH